MGGLNSFHTHAYLHLFIATSKQNAEIGKEYNLEFPHTISNATSISCLKDEVEIFYWSKGGSGTFEARWANRGFQINNTVNKLTIKIPEVISQDGGIYRCTFEGKTYKDSAETNLITNSKYLHIQYICIF